MRITIIGTGFVGVVSAAVFAHLGNQVTGLDIDQQKIDSLTRGKVPFYEPELEVLLLSQQAQGKLTFTTSYQDAIPEAELIIIAVGTPSAPDGQADMRYVFAAAESMAPYLSPEAIVAVKSTVPPGTLNQVESIINKHTKVPFYTASLPEFLREGKAVSDTLHPDRIVIGATNQAAFNKLASLHQPLNAPIIKVSPTSAQMGKYAANAYLATRITFINQIADLCQKNEANVEEVIEIIGKDKRIGEHYWYPGFGYGGSCFPKDVNELAAYSRTVNESSNLFNKLTELNNLRIPKLMDQYAEAAGGFDGKKVAVLGLSFKPHTNDMREAPSIKVIQYLTRFKTEVVGYDPKALSVVEYFITPHPQVTYAESIQKAIEDADVIMALIEWPEIVEFDFPPTNGKKIWFIDARNQFDSQKLTQLGYHYNGVGKV